MIRYSLAWRDPDAHLFDLTTGFFAAHNAPRLVLPSWRPGRYLTQGFAANVRQWSGKLSKVATAVSDGGGAAVEAEHEV